MTAPATRLHEVVTDDNTNALVIENSILVTDDTALVTDDTTNALVIDNTILETCDTTLVTDYTRCYD